MDICVSKTLKFSSSRNVEFSFPKIRICSNSKSAFPKEKKQNGYQNLFKISKISQKQPSSCMKIIKHSFKKCPPIRAKSSLGNLQRLEPKMPTNLNDQNNRQFKGVKKETFPMNQRRLKYLRKIYSNNKNLQQMIFSPNNDNIREFPITERKIKKGTLPQIISESVRTEFQSEQFMDEIGQLSIILRKNNSKEDSLNEILQGIS